MRGDRAAGAPADGPADGPNAPDELDVEVRAFIARTEACYPADANGAPPARQRTLYDAMCRDFHAGRPPGVAVVDERLALPGRAIAVRHYARAGTGARGASPRVVYLHGGGFVVGGLDSHDDVCAELCAGTGLDVTAVDYRLAPEHPHPAAFDDALAAAAHLAGGGRRSLLLCGDSAGGNLAAAVAGAARGTDTMIAGQVLIYPGLGGDATKGSYVTRADAPMLSTREVRAYEALRLGPRPPADPATASPLRARDFSSLPPTVVFSAAVDPLCDDGRDYRDALVAAGARALWVEEAGLVHGYLRARHSAARARASFARILDALAMLAAGEWRE